MVANVPIKKQWGVTKGKQWGVTWGKYRDWGHDFQG